MYFEVLVEGGADVPAVKEIMHRKFGFVYGQDFRVHAHKGKGKIPNNLLAHPNIKRRGLLDQLPSKLRGMSWMDDNYCLVVLVDADNQNCIELKNQLMDIYQGLDRKPPNVLFRIAVEETESWFIADLNALQSAYPAANTSNIEDIIPDSVVGSWERLAESLGIKPENCRGTDKYEWAQNISPYLNLDTPHSPSLHTFITGIENQVNTRKD